MSRGKFRLYCQGVKIFAKGEVADLGDGSFWYKDKVYNIDKFFSFRVNLDRTKVEPFCTEDEWFVPKEDVHHKDKTEREEGFDQMTVAVLSSNIDDCPDIKEALDV